MKVEYRTVKLPEKIDLPTMLDFYPLQTEEWTRVSRFFENLKEGKLTTTKCRDCNALHWQPRIVCPKCMSDDLEWVELPREGKLHAFVESVVIPLGMEQEMPMIVGVVEIGGLKISTKIDDAKLEDLEVGMDMELKVVKVEDGKQERYWYRFRPKK